MDITRKLKKSLSLSGLTEEEIAFYISVLKKPNSSIYDIAKRSKLPKDRAYKIFESLEDKNLVKSDTSKRNKKILANSLQSFIEKISSQGRKLHQTADSLKELNPYLGFLGLPDQKVSFQTFSEAELGQQFLDIAYMDWECVLAYGSFDDILPFIGINADKEFVKKRIKKGKKALPVLANPGEYSWNEIINNDTKEIRTSSVIYDEKLRDFFVVLLPEQNKVSLWSKNKDGTASGALIESPILSQIHTNIYHYLRDLSQKPLEKTK